MLRTQLKLLFLKRGFWLSFGIMLTLAFLYPVYLLADCIFYGNDISFLYDRQYAYIFCERTVLSGLLYLLVPVVALLPFAASYAVDRRLHAYYALVSRRGLRSYFFTKAFCCMLGGFLVFFLPLVINILVNQLFWPVTFRNTMTNNMFDQYFNDIAETLAHSPDQATLFTRLWQTHPQLVNVLSAGLIGLLGAVSSLASYTCSLFVKRCTYFSIFPMLLLMTAGVMIQKQQAQRGALESMSWDLSDYVTTGYAHYYQYAYFWILCAAVILLCAGILWWKSRQDLLD